MRRVACWRVRGALSRLADRQEPVDLELARHLRGCPRCSHAAAQYKALRTALVSTRRGAGSTGQHLPRVDSRPSRPRQGASRLTRPSAAAAAAGVALAGAMLSRRLLRPNRV